MTYCPWEWILRDVEIAGKPSLNICIKHMHIEAHITIMGILEVNQG